MSTLTATELKAEVQTRVDSGTEGGYLDLTEVRELFDIFADNMNAKKQGYRYLKAIVFAEQFAAAESVNIQSSQDKLVSQDNIEFSTLTVERVSTGKYKVTTGYDDANAANLKDNGRVLVQPFQDLPSANSLRSGDAVFVASDVGISHKITYLSNGVFDLYLVASKGTQNENLVDCNFYLTLEMFNVPTV